LKLFQNVTGPVF